MESGEENMYPFDPDVRPRDQLEGRVLSSGWKVVSRIERGADATGSNFSCGYLVEQEGRKGFLKAIDVQKLFADLPQMMEEMQKLSSQYLHEKQLLGTCADRNLDRIVVAIDSGEVVLKTGEPLTTVMYFVFERAEGDVRKVHAESRPNTRQILQVLHNVAVGISQLHSVEIAHQDIKPSNILEFPRRGIDSNAKIADLGRASHQDNPMPHDECPGAGDRNYWPPEATYSGTPPVWPARRACDLFQLGSLALFLFEGVTATAAMTRRMDPSFLPKSMGGTFEGTFEDALPELRRALQLTCENMESIPAGKSSARLVEIIRELCDPDPALRGHPKNRIGHSNPYALDRYISDLDLAATRAGRRNSWLAA